MFVTASFAAYGEPSAMIIETEGSPPQFSLLVSGLGGNGLNSITDVLIDGKKISSVEKRIDVGHIVKNFILLNDAVMDELRLSCVREKLVQ